ncbi:MAG: class I SAM-dependent methyltransferase [Desulfurococcales archaeon]|nr:class I SAM-dependent methyltransferase [Desulfurococcales archaeon]
MSIFNVFDTLHERYDKWYVRHHDLYLKELEAVPHPERPSLEVGVGTGRFAAPLGIDVGLDPSLPMLHHAKERGVECVAGDGALLPFRDNSFKTVYMVFTLCFLESTTKPLKEVKRVLMPDGRFILCIVPADSGLGKEYMRKDSPFYGVAKFYTVEEVQRILKELGFTVVNLRKTLIRYSDNDFVCFEAAPNDVRN